MIIRQRKAKTIFLKFLNLVSSPAGIMLILCCIVFTVSLYLTHRVRPYTSDDVTWQNILLTWRPFSGQRAVLGSSDNFVSKVPYFFLTGELGHPSRAMLFIQSAILGLSGFILFYISSIYFLIKSGLSLSYRNLLPYLWVASLGYAFSQLFLNPIWRGFEVGLSFMTFALYGAYVYNDKKIKSKPLRLFCHALVIFLLGLLTYSDPFYLYFTLIPILISASIFFIFKIMSFRRLSVIILLLFLVLIMSKFIEYVSMQSGLRLSTTYPVEFISFEKLGKNLSLAIHGILILFGADFFGSKVGDRTTIGALINFSVLAYVTYKFCSVIKDLNLKKMLLNRQSLLMVSLAAFSVFTISLYVLSTVPVDTLLTYRYFIMLVFSCALFLSLVTGPEKKESVLVVGILSISIFMNLYLSFTSDQRYVQSGTFENRNVASAGTVENPANAQNFALINSLGVKGLSKGYSNYWQSTINTYLSNGSVKILPVVCSEGYVRKFVWLVDSGQFNLQSAKSFYIVDPDTADLKPCTQEQLYKQFGAPVEELKVGHKTILVYGYDILIKM